MQNCTALSSTNGQQWWGPEGAIKTLDLACPMPAVRRLVLGDLKPGFQLAATTELCDLLNRVATVFPQLTHLHVWNVQGLVEVGALPATLLALDLRGCHELQKIAPLPESARLQTLDLADCSQLTALPESARLQTLDLADCSQLTALPQANVAALTRVWLHGCRALQTFQPLRATVDRLQHLELHDCRFQDLSADLCGESGENVADKVRQHFQALQEQSTAVLAECKLIVLGDGGVGKTSLVKAIMGQMHNPQEEQTHGIRLWRWGGVTKGQKPVLFPECPDASLTLNIWDFGGQDLYHNTHRLFMETQAVFVIVERLSPPGVPRRTEYPDDQVRPLRYWLDQVAAATAGSQHQPHVLIVRTGLDETNAQSDAVSNWKDRVKSQCSYPSFELSCLDAQRETEEWEKFRNAVLEKVRANLGGATNVQLPRGRVAVREKLKLSQPDMDENRPAQDDRPLLLRHEFNTLVTQTFQDGQLSEPNEDELKWQLDFFHQRGVVYAPRSWLDQSLTPGASPVIVDQRWLIEGIYELISTANTGSAWHQARGHVMQKDLDTAWDQLQERRSDLKYESQARWAMRACMENFGLLIPTHGGENRAWILPEFLPNRELVLSPLRNWGQEPLQQWNDQAKRCFCLSDSRLGLSVGCQLIGWLVRTFGTKSRLYRFGALVTLRIDAAASNGCADVPVELRWEKESEQNFAGNLWLWIPEDCRFETQVLSYLEDELRRWKLVPEETRFARVEFRDPGSTQTEVRPVTTLQQERRPQRYPAIVQPVVTLGRVGISMAGGEEGSELEYWPKLIDEMLTKKSGGKFQVVRYRNLDHTTRTIHQITQALAASDLLIAVISDKYLRSPYCMVELLLAARQWSNRADESQRHPHGFLGQPEEWLPRIWFVVLSDASWVLESEEEPVNHWARRLLLEAATYVFEQTVGRDGDETAEQTSPATHVYDAWMRFVNLDIKKPKIFRDAIKSDEQRKVLLLQGCPSEQAQDEWALGRLEPYMTKFLLPAIQAQIDGMQRTQKIQRYVQLALNYHRAGEQSRAFEYVNVCLKEFSDPQAVAQCLRDDSTIPQELEPLKPFLPTWRDYQGLPK